MLVDNTGIRLDLCDPALARILGSKAGEEGGNVLKEAILCGCSRVKLEHWLYCLANTPGSLLRNRLIESIGQKPEQFIDVIAAGIDREETASGPLLERLTSETITPDVAAMGERAEALRIRHKAARINEACLTLAILETADGNLRCMLEAWAQAEGLKRLSSYLVTRINPTGEVKREDLFDQAGKLKLALFSKNGRKFCRRLREDVASLGARQITASHLLYTLLGQEEGLLYRALALRGVDVKKTLHPLLVRELTRPGRKRNMDFSITSETLLGGAADVIVCAANQAADRGEAGISEAGISRAFVLRQSKILANLFSAREPLDVKSLRDYLDSAEPEELEEDKPVMRLSIAEIESGIKSRIKGQDQATQRILPWVKRLRFGLPRESRPAAVLLFLGPTGTGKTQMAKELARYVYGDEDMLIFLEMGQFQTKESMSGFIGAPPGYVGYGDGKLTNGLRDKPESVVLFDEIEKADVTVFDTLLRFADEGLISDPAGPVRDGRRCIIVMTTNAGQQWMQSKYFQAAQVLRNPANHVDQLAAMLQKARADENLPYLLLDAAKAELQERGFRPEFIGRVDELITFLPFDLPTCRAILDRVLEDEASKLKDHKGIALTVDEEARNRLAKKAMIRSLTEGARGVPRAVNEYIINEAIDLVTAGLGPLAASRIHVFSEGKEDVAGKDVRVRVE